MSAAVMLSLLPAPPGQLEGLWCCDISFRCSVGLLAHLQVFIRHFDAVDLVHFLKFLHAPLMGYRVMVPAQAHLSQITVVNRQPVPSHPDRVNMVDLPGFPHTQHFLFISRNTGTSRYRPSGLLHNQKGERHFPGAYLPEWY